MPEHRDFNGERYGLKRNGLYLNSLASSVKLGKDIRHALRDAAIVLLSIAFLIAALVILSSTR